MHKTLLGVVAAAAAALLLVGAGSLPAVADEEDTSWTTPAAVPSPIPSGDDTSW